MTRLPPAEITELKLGYMRLTDSAPLILAKEAGLFERYGLSVELKRGVSWANLRDKLAVGELDAAQLLAPLAYRYHAGHWWFTRKSADRTVSQPEWQRHYPVEHDLGSTEYSGQCPGP